MAKTLTLTQGTTAITIQVTAFNYSGAKTSKVVDYPKSRQKQSEGSFARIIDLLKITKQISFKGVIAGDGTWCPADQAARLMLMQENAYNTAQPVLKVAYDAIILDPTGATTTYGPQSPQDGSTTGTNNPSSAARGPVKIGGVIENLKISEKPSDIDLASSTSDTEVYTYEVDITLRLVNVK